ncbi:MAG: hypothetical protein IPG32_04545 [Saprospirales bacterium]|nr:hypothetical protein [Saprospirales bacterium]
MLEEMFFSKQLFAGIQKRSFVPFAERYAEQSNLVEKDQGFSQVCIEPDKTFSALAPRAFLTGSSGYLEALF